MVRFPALALVCCLAAVPASATTLVALWTPERILLGADSRVVSAGPEAGEACKIVQTGNLWLAVSGLIADPGTGYELGPLARTALNDAGTMGDRLFRFAGAVQRPLQRAADAMKRDSPSEYARFADGQPVLQAILAAEEKGRPVLATIGFTLAADGLIQPRASLVDGLDACGPRLIYAGQQTRIRQYLRTNRDWFGQSGEKLVLGLVQMEVEANPDLVGGPVDLIEVGAGGTHWIQRKPTCR